MHDGHRKRLKKRFLNEGLDHFEPHNMLELLLTYCIPQKDVNPLAHKLMDRFLTLDAVFDAPIDELVKIPGIGEHSATLIKLVAELGRQYEIAKRQDSGSLDSTEKMGRYILPYYRGKTEEYVYIICLDAKCRVLGCTEIFKGSVNSAQINIRLIVETALRYRSSGVVLVHNHPGGVAIPSAEDIATTRKIQRAMAPLGLALLDHLIVADGDFVSLADSNLFDKSI